MLPAGWVQVALGDQAAREVRPHMLPAVAHLGKVSCAGGGVGSVGYVDIAGMGEGKERLVGTVAVDILPVMVLCALAATAALIASISLFREAISSLITCTAALFDIVTSLNKLVIMVRSLSSPP